MNVAPAYVGYLAANLLTAQTRGWLLGQGHCGAAIEAANCLVDNLSPAQTGRYGPDEAGPSRLCADFYSYDIDAAGRPTAHTLSPSSVLSRTIWNRFLRRPPFRGLSTMHWSPRCVQGCWPLFAGGLINGKVKEARAQLREPVTGAREDMQTSRALVEAATDQETAAASALDSVRNEVRVGQKPTLDLLNAERESLAAHSTRVVAWGKAVVASYRLNALLHGD